MIDAEKLLGKVVEEVIGSGHGIKKLKKKKKKKKKSSLLSCLSSGAGLMTAIGLGVGAYEILKDKSKQQAYGGTASNPAGGGPSSEYNHTGLGQSTPPPPPPPPTGTQQHSPAESLRTMEPDEVESLAVRMIQAMIAAAHADGTMDADEEVAVIGRLKEESFTQEEKMFLLGEMHNPKSLDQLTAGISDQAVAKTMYMLAVNTIEIDTPEERQWLDDLSSRLGLSKAVQEFIEEQI